MTTIPAKVKVSSDYLHAIACANERPDLTDSLDKHMTRELCALEKQWVARVNRVGDGKWRSDVVELSQIVWDGLDLALQVSELLNGFADEIFGDEQWQVIYIPPFFVEHTVFCGRRTGVKFAAPLLRKEGYVIYPVETVVGRSLGGAGLSAFYVEFRRLLDGVDGGGCEEIQKMRDELVVRMGG